MPVPSTYDDLVTEIQALLEDDNAELVAYLPTAIGLAESALFKALDVDWSTTTDIATVASTNTVSKPPGYRAGHNLYLTVSGSKIRLIKKTEDFIYDYWPNSSTVDVPKYYADKDSNTFLLAPTPAAIYTVTVEYETMPTALSSSQQTNRYTIDYPEALFYASVYEAASYLRNPEVASEYQSKMMTTIELINAQGARLRTDDAKNTANPQIGRNIKGQA
jgi:hypothetical protein